MTMLIMKYYMTQNLPNVNESYDKAKNFLKDNFGFDFSGRIDRASCRPDGPGGCRRSGIP